MDKIQLKTSFIFKDMLFASVELFLHNQPKLFVYGIILILFLIIFIPMLLSEPKLIISLLTLLIIMLIIIYIQITNNVISVIMGENKDNITITITNKGIEVNNGINRIRYSVDSIDFIRETKNYLWLEFTDPRSNFYIKKLDTLTRLEIEQIEELINNS
jgi:hypothetical protein